jgi:hypothetical protein
MTNEPGQPAQQDETAPPEPEIPFGDVESSQRADIPFGEVELLEKAPDIEKKG